MLRLRDCSVLSSDQRLAFPPDARYVYPDVTVIGSPPEFQPGTSDVITNPSIIVQVLSGSTEEYDRGSKWTGYQRITALTADTTCSSPNRSPNRALPAQRRWLVDQSNRWPRRANRTDWRRHVRS